MKKILEFLGGNVIKEIGDIIDNLFTNDEERIEAKNKIIQVLKEKELELQKMQTEIIISEAKGNWLQRSWRPILMLAFGFIVIYVKFLAPLFNFRIPELENEFWNLLQ
jgi:preprotein translocase subunit SecF